MAAMVFLKLSWQDHFPIPNSALEIVWNHALRYRGERIARDFNYAVPTVGGDYVLTYTRDEVVFPYSPMLRIKERKIWMAFRSISWPTPLLPSRRQCGLVHETLNMAKEGRKAWTYSPGTRRVRRAPNIAYDNPITNGDGMGTSDQYDGYNGAPDRYDWTVVGKQEKLSIKITTNSLTPVEDIVKPGRPNQDPVRYEMRRQWVVEGNLKNSARHIYAKRVLRMDEDSGQMTAGEMYDGRGELWRVQEIGQAPDYRPEAATCWTTGGEWVYDLLAGRYMVLQLKSGRPSITVTVWSV